MDKGLFSSCFLTLLPGTAGRIHIHLGCGFRGLGTIPQGANIGATFLVATMGGINIGTQGNFGVVPVLGKDTITVRAFRKRCRYALIFRFLVTLPRRGLSIGHRGFRCGIFSRCGDFFRLGLSAPSAGPLFAACGGFRCGGWAGCHRLPE